MRQSPGLFSAIAEQRPALGEGGGQRGETALTLPSLPLPASRPAGWPDALPRPGHSCPLARPPGASSGPCAGPAGGSQSTEEDARPGVRSLPACPLHKLSSGGIQGFACGPLGHLCWSGRGRAGRALGRPGRLPGHRPAALQRDAGGRVARLTGERQRLTAFFKLFFVLAPQPLEAIGAVPLEEFPLRPPPPRWLFRPQGTGGLFVQALGV